MRLPHPTVRRIACKYPKRLNTDNCQGPPDLQLENKQSKEGKKNTTKSVKKDIEPPKLSTEEGLEGDGVAEANFHTPNNKPENTPINNDMELTPPAHTTYPILEGLSLHLQNRLLTSPHMENKIFYNLDEDGKKRF